MLDIWHKRAFHVRKEPHEIDFISLCLIGQTSSILSNILVRYIINQHPNRERKRFNDQNEFKCILNLQWRFVISIGLGRCRRSLLPFVFLSWIAAVCIIRSFWNFNSSKVLFKLENLSTNFLSHFESQIFTLKLASWQLPVIRQWKQ